MAGRAAVGGLAACLFTLTGCASTRPDPFAARFIVSGTPAVDVDWSVPDAGPAPRAPTPRAHAPAGTPPGPRAATLGTTIESVTPSLRAKLDALAATRSVAAYLDVAAAYRTLGIPDRAFDYLAAGLKDHPRHGTLHEAIARQWQAWGLPARGLRDAHLAVRYAPRSPAAQTTLGRILWDLGRYDDAAAAFTTAARLAPAAAYARHNHCAAARALGRTAPDDCPATPVLPPRTPVRR